MFFKSVVQMLLLPLNEYKRQKKKKVVSTDCMDA